MSKKYDVFGLNQLIERGLGRKLELLENAINKLDPAMEPITIVDNYAFTVNTNNGETYRIKFDINEGNSVSFYEPVPFELDTDLTRFEKQSKRIISNIVESLSSNDNEGAEFHKGQWIANQRQKNILESKLDLNIGTRSKYINQTKKIVADAVKSSRGARTLIGKGRSSSPLNTLLGSGKVTIQESEIRRYDADKSRKQLIYTKIVETRNQAKSLVESPIFTDYVLNLYKGQDTNEAVEFIAQNYQEIFTLSLSEQTALFYNIVEKATNKKPEFKTVVECVFSIGNYATNNQEIVAELAKLSELIGSEGADFHTRMSLIEDEINVHSYTGSDLKTLISVLEHIVRSPSEFMAPEFVVEARRALGRINSMAESGNIDDAVVTVAINLVSQFYPQTMSIANESKESDAYQKFFQGKLEKFGVKSPDELSDEDKKKLFNEVEAEWKEDKSKSKGKEDQEVVEAVDKQTGFPKATLKKLLEDEMSADGEEDTTTEVKSKKEDDEDDEKPTTVKPEQPTIESVKMKFKGVKGAASLEQIDGCLDDLKKAKNGLEGDDLEAAEELEDEIVAERFLAQ